MNAEAVKLLPSEYAKRCFIIYLDIPMETRIERITLRNDKNDDVMRRVRDDERQYLDFSQFDCRITNPNF